MAPLVCLKNKLASKSIMLNTSSTTSSGTAAEGLLKIQAVTHQADGCQSVGA